MIPENEVARMVQKDYLIRLSQADNSVKAFICPRPVQTIINEIDDLEYNNERKHYKRNENLIPKNGMNDPLMMTFERPPEYEVERTELPRMDDIVNKVYPLLTKEEKYAFDEVIRFGRMSRKELAESHHVSYATVSRWMERIQKVSKLALKEELSDMLEY
jgi:hypothetical protein